MKKILCYWLSLIFCLVSTILLNGQEQKIQATDSLFREDQCYVSLSYNLLQNKPSGFNQYSFSSGISFGFLRDIPFTKNRHWSIAPGIGYSYSNLKQNVKIQSIGNQNSFEIQNDFDKNKLVLHYLEFPLEIRWRNASMDSHKFWRIHSGFKLSYLIGSKSQFESNTNQIRIKQIAALNNWQYSIFFVVGYNSINVYANYGLNPIFSNAVTTTNEEVNLTNFNLGLQFYIL